MTGVAGWLFGNAGSESGGGLDAAGAASAAKAAIIDYAPMRALLDGGLVDTGYMSSKRAAAAAARGTGVAADAEAGLLLQNHSVPTLINEDVMHAAPLRLDYALANAPLVERCLLTTTITRDADTETMSDHYPLLTDVDCAA